MAERPKPETAVTERLLEILRPYGSGWSSVLARGDLVIPQRDIPKLMREIAQATIELTDRREVSERELFDALSDVRRAPSLQDQVTELRRRFHVSHRPD